MTTIENLLLDYLQVVGSKLMHPKFDVRDFMRQLDSPCYKTGIHTDCFLEREFVRNLINFVISCLINKLPMPMMCGRSPDWLGEPR